MNDPIDQVRLLLRDPFAFVPDLKPEEKRTLEMLARGSDPRSVARLLNVSRRSVYRLSRRGCAKVGAALGRDEANAVRPDELSALVFHLLEGAVGL